MPIKDRYDSIDYKRTRKAYFFQCVFEYCVTLLMTDVFLARLLSNMGISDGMNGIISSIISLSFLFQLFSIFFARKITNTKRVCAFVKTFSLILFMLVYLVPFVPFSREIKTVLVTVLIFAGYICNYAIDGIFYKLVYYFVSPNKRGNMLLQMK